MCMKYVNASVRCYKKVTTMGNNILSYDLPFESMKYDNERDGIAINNFVVITNIDFLGTSTPEHKSENPLENRKTLDFIIRLTKCSSDATKRIGYDIDKFSIDLAELYRTKQVNTACFDYLTYTRTTNIEHLSLPGGDGKYVIKVLIKDSKDTDYTIQTMSPLTIV